jgi:ABC-type polysaccharide/polyol phosphate transport system ATPase subunit
MGRRLPQGRKIESILSNVIGSRDKDDPYIWALRDVSFQVNKGEAVGIIGRNGSGKTTLLRVLSGISPPTEGRVLMQDRFAALFAASTGFNMELSGIKNIYLSAAIAGFHPRETDKKINDIVEFSELGSFVYQPVKRYSSGMRARLGFSIVIHTLPEIVLIDEALSGGDVRFKEKCVDRFKEMRRDGLTLLFVSHSRTQMLEICERAIWLEKGRLKMDGPAPEIMEAYEDEAGVRRKR